ncbi:phosphatase PAP2 family protein [Bombilactobacillus folatiphilus]|uniref:phosphatase PAP2 family protein n=1 Tax=Bombilactobacillus folatiphilus TaxID=2923362 RepID=UPI0037BFC610
MSIVIIIFLKTTRQQIFFSGTILTNLLLNNILKNIFQRPRPTLIHLVHANGFSFPSGHAMATTSFFLSLGIIYYQITKKKQLPFLFMIIAFTIILSRPILHVHYLSDVLAGTCLAISITLIWKLLCFENPLINSDSSNQKNLLSKSHSK